MRLNDYKLSSEYDKRKWLETFHITAGLPYFGGKAFIGKYLMNRICNMAVQMDNDGKKADYFIDVFGGGGKIALSIPEGWFDTIVLNDINYGITSFFTCCKEQPDELIELIEKLGSIMDKDLFHILAFIRSNDGRTDLEKEYLKKKNDNFEEANEEQESRYLKYKNVLFDKRIEPLLSAAATYWVTKLDFLGVTEPLKVSYKASIKDNKSETIDKANEKKMIENAIKNAKSHIINVGQILRQKNIVIERLDFAELVKKYNGMAYKNIYDEPMKPLDYASKNKLWYFDSPYHPSTLNNGEEAPYEDTFDISLVAKMTQIVHNDFINEYGKIDYFIKSDYDPKESYRFAKEMIEKYKKEEQKLILDGVGVDSEETGKETLQAKRLKTIQKYIKKLEEQIKGLTTVTDFGEIKEIPYYHFDCLEDNSACTKMGIKPEQERQYYKECLGEFTKGSVNKITEQKVIGKEYIWFKGMKSEITEKLDKSFSEKLQVDIQKSEEARKKKEKK